MKCFTCYNSFVIIKQICYRLYVNKKYKILQNNIKYKNVNRSYIYQMILQITHNFNKKNNIWLIIIQINTSKFILINFKIQIRYDKDIF